MNPYIKTVSGQKVHFLTPNPDEFDIQDIAFHLGRICRFAGGPTRRFSNGFYSVAEHSVILSNLLDEYPPIVRLRGLLHDAAEMVIGDIPSPVKHMFPQLMQLENSVLACILNKFTGSPELEQAIKVYDQRLYEIEVEVFRNNAEIEVNLFHFWEPAKATEEFLFLFYYLAELSK